MSHKQSLLYTLIIIISALPNIASPINEALAINTEGRGYVSIDTTKFIAPDEPIVTPIADRNIDIETLEEYVVIGYGTTKKRNNTAATAIIESPETISGEASSLTEALKGKIAGVRVRSNEGGVLSEDDIVIRGGTTITGDNAPLFVVDGFPVEGISDIPASDIERIDIIKDAASAAIYGARAAGGVILITTKKAKEYGLHLSYSSNYTFGRMSGKLETLSPEEFARLNYEAAALKGADSYNSFVEMYGDYNGLKQYADIEHTDYMKELYGRQTFSMTQNAALTYRNDKTMMRAAYQYDSNEGVMLGSDMKRHNFILNLDQKLWTRAWDILSLNIKAAYTNKETNGAGNGGTEGSTTTSRLKNALLYSPIPLKGDDEDSYEKTAQVYDPLQVEKDDYRHSLNNTIRGDIGLNINPREWLAMQTRFGIEGMFGTIERCYGSATSQARQYNSQPIATVRENRNTTLSVSNIITAKPLYNIYRHDLTVMAGHEFTRKNKTYRLEESRYFPDFLSAEQCIANMSLGKPEPTTSYTNPADALLSFFGRASYSFADRYMITATIRGDRSSIFAEGRQWGAFPGISAAWKLSEEEFMKKAKSVMTSAKLRASIGMAGNNRIVSSLYENRYMAQSPTDPNLTINGEAQTYIKGTKYMANPDLTWETTISRNAGLDLSFFKSRLNLTADFYINTTDDLLLQVDMPKESGYEYMMRNVGSTSTRGMEFAVEGKIVQQKRWGVSVSANIAFAKNRVESLGGKEEIEMSSKWAGSEIKGDYILRVGEPVGSIYGYETMGMYRAEDFYYEDEVYRLKDGIASDASLLSASGGKPGTLRLKDQNGDGIIDEMDRVIIGCAQPLHTGGLTLKAYCYGFDLNVDFDWSYGNDVLNATKIESTTSNKYSMRNMTAEAKERWTYIDNRGNVVEDPVLLTELNSNAKMWSPIMGRYITHSWAVEDGSFLRLSNITLGYTLPEKIAKKIRLQKLRIHASVGNLKCWTKYSGLDPEVSVKRETAATPGVDYSAMPKKRTVGFGVEVGW